MEREHRRAKRTKIWTLWAIITCSMMPYKPGSWVISRKRSIVEQNGPKFGPSGLYSEHIGAKYGRKVKTGSWFHQTGSWVISRKRSVVEQNGPKFGPFGLLLHVV